MNAFTNLGKSGVSADVLMIQNAKSADGKNAIFGVGATKERRGVALLFRADQSIAVANVASPGAGDANKGGHGSKTPICSVCRRFGLSWRTQL
jgi:hypothetical protein